MPPPIGHDTGSFISAGRRLLAVREVSLPVQTRIWKKPEGVSALGFTLPSYHLDVRGHCYSFFCLSKSGGLVTAYCVSLRSQSIGRLYPLVNIYFLRRVIDGRSKYGFTLFLQRLIIRR